LAEAGAVLAFGSDAPVETADPLQGIDAASAWRKRAGWHPELAISPAKALRAYTLGAAFAAGMEQHLGSLRLGKLCDVTVVDDSGVAATIVGAKVSWRRTPR
jgi:predicted amidohydrolase YtcJ